MSDLAALLSRIRPPMTPALVVRRRALEANLRAMQADCDAAGMALRAHGKMHKCSRIARMQVAAGAVGLCCQTVGEAQAFAQAGIADLLVTAPVAPWAAPTLAALAREARVGVVVDDIGQVERLEAAAHAAGTRLNLVVDIDLGLHRTGCAVADVLPLTRRIAASDAVAFDGVQAYLGHLQHLPDIDARAAANTAATAELAQIVADLVAAGLKPPRVTGGGTGTFAFDLAGGVFTELQAGSYALMDVDYGDCGSPDGGAWPFEPALFVAASVVSARHKSHVVSDAGLKALSVDGPPARVVAGAAPGSFWHAMGDEHGAVVHPAMAQRLIAAGGDVLARDAAIRALDADPAVQWPDGAPACGDIVWLQPGHCDPTVNLHDALWVADEDGRLERWPIDARRVSALPAG
jgi:D-serine deaminase-like pyridoxal phosphate-dependent protein